MPPPNRVKLPTSVEHLHWLLTDDGSRTLWDDSLGESYHSGCGAVSESLTVYLYNSGLAQRCERSRASSVLEYGFGTGMAFLLTAAYAELFHSQLRYVSLEKQMLNIELVAGLEIVHATRSQTPAWLASNRMAFCDLLERFHAQLVESLRLWDSTQPTRQIPFSEHVDLTLWCGDALEFDGPLAGEQLYDVIYFDPFSPETNPDLWSESVFRQAHQMLRPRGTLTSYCVKGSIRRLLSQQGFEVAKLPGPPGGKREVLLASKPAPTR